MVMLCVVCCVWMLGDAERRPFKTSFSRDFWGRRVQGTRAEETEEETGDRDTQETRLKVTYMLADRNILASEELIDCKKSGPCVDTEGTL